MGKDWKSSESGEIGHFESFCATSVGKGLPFSVFDKLEMYVCTEGRDGGGGVDQTKHEC